MAQLQIRFEDGASYERSMAVWSRLAGEVFLDWLAPAGGLRWLDVGCGNGAFTQLIVERAAPSWVEGIDPARAQIEYAMSRPAGRTATFRTGDATALPYTDASVDVAVMALVIFFVPEPARGVAEMARVVRAGGCVCSYSWDILGGGFPFAELGRALRDMGHSPSLPPRVDISDMNGLAALWRGAGLEQIETRAITVQRRFDDFEQLWSACLQFPTLKARLAEMTAAQAQELKHRVREKARTDAAGAITCSARANAIRGHVPGAAAMRG